jgi:DNA-binding winged helix-turn-helix (wHTH) protein
MRLLNIALIEMRGEIVGKDDLMKLIWADTIVEESNLAHHLHVLRKTLGQRNNGHTFIETFRGRGYRFNSEVQVVKEADAPKRNGQKARPSWVFLDLRTSNRRTVCRLTPLSQPRRQFKYLIEFVIGRWLQPSVLLLS